MLQSVTVTTEREVKIRTKDLLTATRAAEYLGVSRMTLWRWVRDGKIRPVEFDNQRFFHISELRTLKEAKQKEGG